MLKIFIDQMRKYKMSNFQKNSAFRFPFMSKPVIDGQSSIVCIKADPKQNLVVLHA